MRHCRRPDQYQFRVELMAVNVRVITMYQRTALSQSDASVSTLLMTIQKPYLTSAQRAVLVRSSQVPTLVVVDNQHMHIRLVQLKTKSDEFIFSPYLFIKNSSWQVVRIKNLVIIIFFKSRPSSPSQDEYRKCPTCNNSNTT